MKLKDKKIGLGITGSFCNFNRVKEVIRSLKEQGAEVYPILSFNANDLDTKFYKAKEFRKMVEEETEHKIISDIQGAEPIGPKNMMDILLICPCTGNTIAKIANGIVDTPVTMAFKSHIRNNKKVVIAISTNDAMGSNFKNIAEVYNMKNIFFVPFGQDDYLNKPKSLVLDYTKIIDAIVMAIENRQIQPVLKRE